MASLGWLIVTRDSRIQQHRAEIEAVKASNARMVALAGDEARGAFGGATAVGPSLPEVHEGEASEEGVENEEPPVSEDNQSRRHGHAWKAVMCGIKAHSKRVREMGRNHEQGQSPGLAVTDICSAKGSLQIFPSQLAPMRVHGLPLSIEDQSDWQVGTADLVKQVAVSFDDLGIVQREGSEEVVRAVDVVLGVYAQERDLLPVSGVRPLQRGHLACAKERTTRPTD